MKRTHIMIAVFFACILSPNLLFPILKTTADEGTGENRSLAAFPTLSLETIDTFPSGVEDWINDHAAFRNRFLSLNARLNLSLFQFGDSQDVITGKDGWYFYTLGSSVEDFLGTNRFSAGELQMLAHKLQTVHDAWKEKGTEFIFLCAPNKEGVYRMYPHELSGGMRQRICIAMALACNPKLIIADEPTTALDVTIQAQVLDLLRNLKDKINSSIMLITHDLGVVAEMADYVVVMYAGRVVEKGTAREIFKDPRHPYTIGLMNSKPVVGKHIDKLYSIPGSVPNPVDMPNYCYFKDRCEMCVEGCEGAYPAAYHVSPTHVVSCYRCKEGGTQNE